MGPKQLYLHTSNRMENLAARLVEVSNSQPLPSTLSQETVMTLNPGIARWLRFEVARLTGISFGWEFPLPAKLYTQILLGLEPKFQDQGLFDESKATWLLNDILAKLEDKPRFDLVRAYCASSSPTRRFAFAARLARLYDEYLIYRPEQIIEWEDKPIPGYDWQGEIWKRLARAHYPKQNQAPHIARLWDGLRQSNSKLSHPDLEPLPERLFVFGVSSLAPIYLDFLDYLSRFRPVHIFLLQPSNLYWADLKSTKEIAKIVSQQPSARESDELDPNDWIHDTGNPLLPSLGKQGQIFLDLIIDRDPLQDDFAFQEPEEPTQLGALQSDLFNIVDHSSASEQASSNFPVYDGSLQFHSTSSKRREIESLWDHLIDRLEQNPELQASEILVMAPDIQEYASHIEAVFAAKRGTSLEIPYSIADRSSQQTSPVLSGLAALLDIPTGRASSKEILSLLQRPLFRDVLNFDDRDLEAIEFWIRELGITWGWDAAHRKQNGGFETDRNTWSELENRLSAGLCLGIENTFDEGHRFPPFADIEGEFALTAGRFLECLQLLKEVRESQSATASLTEWRERILSFFERLKSNNEDWSQDYRTVVNLLQDTLPELKSITATGAEVYQAILEKLEQSPSRSGYLSGGLTFCSLKPMRAIPAKTICLIGMNYADFPRKTTRLNFDLLAQKTRRGDRNTRDEDRQFFLETLLSARQSLYISYLGMSPSSDEAKEPSTVVTDLQNYLKAAIGEAAFSELLFAHHRQSYASPYFETQKLFTYDPSRAELYNQFNESNKVSSKPSPTPNLPSSKSETHSVQLEELLSYFQNPSRYYVEKTLQAKLARESDDIEELDTLSYDALNRYKFRQDLANRLRQRKELSEIRKQEIQSEKWLPPGHLEAIKMRDELGNASAIAEFLETKLRDHPLETTRLRLSIAGITLSANLETQQGNLDQTIVMPGSWNGARYLEIWIRHLIASLHTQNNSLPSPALTALSFDPASKPFTLQEVNDPQTHLCSLVETFLNGRETPLPIFPKLSRIAFEKWIKPSSKNRKLNEEELEYAVSQETSFLLEGAQSRHKPPFGPSIDWTEYDQVCYGEYFPLPENFLSQSQTLWTPFAEAQEMIKLTASK